MRALPRPVERVLRPGEDGRIFYGWWIVGVSVVIQALIAAFFVQAYASYAVIFERDFGWSKTVLSLAFAMARVEGGMLGPPEGWAIDRFGPRAVTRTGLVLLGLGLLLFSRINSLPVFFAAFLLMSVGASLGGFLPLGVAVVHWFERRRATALGIMQIGFAVGGLVAPLVAWAMVTFGWRETAFTSGVLIVVIALPLVQIVKHRPQDHDLRPDGASAEEEAQRQTAAGASDDGGSPNFTAREAMRTRSFWMISLGHASALLVVGAVMVHLVLHLTDRMGYSIVQANFVFQLLAAMQIAGQLGGGYLGDRVSKRALLMACMVGHALGILMLAFASTLWMVIGFTVLHGMAWGTRGPVVMAIRGGLFRDHLVRDDHGLLRSDHDGRNSRWPRPGRRPGRPHGQLPVRLHGARPGRHAGFGLLPVRKKAAAAAAPAGVGRGDGFAPPPSRRSRQATLGAGN